MIATIGTPLLWIGFTLFILSMLALDLGLFHRRAHTISVREAIFWTILWISIALTFNTGIWVWFGSERALEFLTGYLIEKALSIDNIFVFLIIFSYFKVPEKFQHRVLFLGILGALIMRAIFIVIGAMLLQKFHWVTYLFGALLFATGAKLLFKPVSSVQPEHNFIVKLFKKIVPVKTPLLLVLISVEVTDLIFAIDSIPAIFAVTSDPFIVYTSNIFAILGLRSLYFAISKMMSRFSYVRIGLALVLAFVGAKMLLSSVIQIPILLSLLVVVTFIGGSIFVSLRRPK